MPQPSAEPTSREAIKDHLSITDSSDDTFIDDVAAATNAYVRGLRVADIDVEVTDPWPPTISFGATMLGARWVSRRNSPDGIQAMTDQGAAYVARSDPDIAQLLKLGPYSSPIAR